MRSSSDELRLVFVPTQGNFELSARIDCVSDPGGAGLGGLMVRDTLDSFSAHVFFALNSSVPAGGGVGTLKGYLRRQTSKTQPTAPILIDDNGKDVVGLPVWLKIKREGAKLFFQRSPDGGLYANVAEREIGTGATMVNLRDQVFMGLAVTGGGAGTMRVRFSEVSGPPFGESGSTFRRGDVDGNGSVDISDAVATLGFLFLGQTEPACREAADSDNNGAVDISDPIASLTYQFLGGPAPLDPGPTICGIDPVEPFLGCKEPCR